MIAIWWELMRDHSLEFAAAFLALYGIWRLFDRSVSAQWGYVLFLILGLKLVLPGVVSLPLLPRIELASAPQPARPEAGEEKVIATVREGEKKADVMVESLPAPDPIRQNVAPAVSSGREFASFPDFSFQAGLFGIWSLVVIILTLREVRNHIRLRSLARRCPLLRDEDIGLDLNALAWQACVDRPVRWISADWARSPMTYGVLHPVIIVPTALEEKVPRTQLRWILMHELAHIRRGDYLVYLLQRMITILYFFHPLVWWNHRLVDALREYACDEEATAKSTSSIRDCCEGLLSIAALRSGIGSPVSPASAVVHSETFLRRRLMKIVQPQTNKIMQWIGWPVLSVCLLSLIVFSVGNVVTAAPQDAAGTVPVPPAAQALPAAPAEPAAPAAEAPASEGLASLKEQMEDQETVVAANDFPVGSTSGFSVETVEGIIQMKGVPSQGNTPISFLVTCDVRDRSGNPVEESLRGEVAKKILVEDGEESDPSRMRKRIRYADDLPGGVNVSLFVRVLIPSTLNASASTGDGDVQIEDFDGMVDGQTGDGDVNVQNCRGQAAVNTGDGDANLLNIGGKVIAQTGDGDLAIQNSQGEVHATTGDGDIAVLNIGGDVTAQSGDGDIAIQNCEKSVTATLGEGDLSIESCQGAVQATNGEGDLSFVRCHGSVTANNGAGNVTAQEVEGPFTAQTGEGDLVVEQVADCRKLVTSEGDIVLNLSKAPTEPLNCLSGEGDIVVTLPKGAAVTLNATVSSEGQVDLQEKEAFQGTREEKSVKGTLNGGGTAVTLQVESGAIVIQTQ